MHSILPLGKLVRWDTVTARHKCCDLFANGPFKGNVSFFASSAKAQLSAKMSDGGDGAALGRLEYSFAWCARRCSAWVHDQVLLLN